MKIKEQAIAAIKVVESLFDEGMPPIPEEATVDTLWAEICRLRGKVKKPKKVEAIRLLLEDERLVGLNPALIADIIRNVYKRHNVPCDTTEASIRWYVSQKTMEWNIKPRVKQGPETNIDNM